MHRSHALNITLPILTAWTEPFGLSQYKHFFTFVAFHLTISSLHEDYANVNTFYILFMLTLYINCATIRYINKVKAMNDQVQNLIQIRKSLKRGKAGNLAQNQAFLDFITIQKKLESEFEATWAVIRERMEQYDIQSIKGDWGAVQFVPYPTYKADGKVAPRFTKQVLDGSEIRHYMKNHSNEAPKGIKVITNLRFRKDIKLGA